MSGSSSMLIASTVKPEARYFSYRRARCGISSRHGPHQLAQKLIITTRPRCSCSRTFSPPRLGSVKSGAPVDAVTAAFAPNAGSAASSAVKRSRAIVVMARVRRRKSRRPSARGSTCSSARRAGPANTCDRGSRPGSPPSPARTRAGRGRNSPSAWSARETSCFRLPRSGTARRPWRTCCRRRPRRAGCCSRRRGCSNRAFSSEVGKMPPGRIRRKLSSLTLVVPYSPSTKKSSVT